MSAKRTGGGLGKSEREAIRQVRVQAMLVAQLGERLAQLEGGGPGGIWRDGCLKDGGGGAGSGAAAGLDKGLILREELTRAAKREGALLRQMEARAREAISGMSAEEYAFCVLYYISGLSLAETARALDRTRRQCERYRKAIEEPEET